MISPLPTATSGPAATRISGVVVEKPWYLSKKIWLCVIALVLAVVQEATGHWTGLTAADLTARIAATASWLLPLLGTILGLAHVDARTRAAALLSDALKTAASLSAADTSNPS